jgi:hypothetical protein
MLSADRAYARLRTVLAVAFALVWAVLVAAIAGASPTSSGPRSQVPLFLLHKGRLTGFDAPGPAAQDLARIDNRGRIVGNYENPSGAAGGPRSPMRMMMMPGL